MFKDEEEAGFESDESPKRSLNRSEKPMPKSNKSLIHNTDMMRS